LLLGVSHASAPAAALDIRLRLEPAFGVWLDEPHTTPFASGGYFAARPALSISPLLDVQVSYAILYTPATHDHSVDNTAHFVTGGLRLRPLSGLRAPGGEYGGLFIDANAGYVRMAGADTFGMDVGLGYEFTLSPWFSIGAVVRYGHILEPDRGDAIPHDGQLITVGLDFGFGPTRPSE